MVVCPLLVTVAEAMHRPSILTNGHIVRNSGGNNRSKRAVGELLQEEIAQMVAVRRERISTALNIFRRKRLIQYSNHGHLVPNLSPLESYAD
jgi:Crp-like helix-turn-helix protein